MFARAAASAAAALSLTTVLGCASGTADTTTARRFDAYPLYWLGSRFEEWKLEQVLGPDGLATS